MAGTPPSLHTATEREPELTADEWATLTALTLRAWRHSTHNTAHWYVWGAVYGMAHDAMLAAKYPEQVGG